MAEAVEQTVRSALAGLVGNRVFPNVIAEKTTLPAIAYQSSREPVNTLMGPTGDRNVTLTLILVGTTFDSVRTLAAQVRDAIAQTPAIVGSLTEEPGDQYDPDTQLHLYYMLYSLWESD